MNELTTFQTGQLPDTIEDLTQFVLVGNAKLEAYKLKLRTVNKLSVAQEIRDQTLQESIEINNAVRFAETRIGEILLTYQKASGGINQYNKEENSTRVEKSKSEITSEQGFSKDQVSDFQRMAKHPEVVKRVLEEATKNNEIAPRSQIMKAIAEEKKRQKELEEENRKLHNALSAKDTENIKLRHELENAPAKETVKEVVKEVRVEVVPDDYEELKEKAKRADIHKAGFEEMRDAYEEMAEKWKKSEAEKDQMRKQMNEPETERAEKLKLSTVAFCGGVANFIERFGGYVWLTQELENMEKRDRDDYIRAIKAIEAWVYRMKENMGVHNDNG